MYLRSPDFRDGGPLPVRFAAQRDAENPELTWGDVPAGTRELVVVVEDPDAPTPRPFVHWVVYAIHPGTRRLPGSIPKEDQPVAPHVRQGRNTMGQLGFAGLNPPFWHRAHRYVFRLLALSAPLGLEPGATRDEVLAALEGKVLAEARLVGKYAKPPRLKVRAIAFWAAILGGLALAIRGGRRLARHARA